MTLATVNAFSFFDFIANAIVLFYNFLFAAFDYLFLFLAQIVDALLAPLYAGIESGAPLLLNLITFALFPVLEYVRGIFLNIFHELINWFVAQLGDYLGQILLWLDDLLPEAVALDTSTVAFVMAYYRAADLFIDVNFVLATASLGIITCWGFTLGRYVWKCIPGVG